MSSYILDSIKQKFGVTEKYSGEEAEGFPDMNYVVGNTSGLDVGQIPTAMDQRIGSQAQLGGGVMEVKISNPSTFSIERDEIITSINQLGLDITLHSEMNVGYCSAYKKRGQQAMGFETVHDYFTRYLNQLAIFKKVVENREDVDFDIGRINPHASTSGLPALEQRMAHDVGLDPFGLSITNNDEENWERKDSMDRNIFRNDEFMKRFYHTFIKKRTVDQLWRLYFGRQGVFSNYSDKFDRIFRDAQRRACDNFYRDELKQFDNIEDELEAKVALVSTAGRADVGVESEWLNSIEEPIEGDFEDLAARDKNGNQLEIQNLTSPPEDVEVTIDNLQDVNEILPPNVRVTRLGTLSEALHRIQNMQWDIRGVQEDEIYIDKEENLRDAILKAMNERLDYLWKGPEEDKFLISVQGKRQALVNHLDIEQQRIFEASLHYKGNDPDDDRDPWELDEAAEEVLTGNPDFFGETQNGEDLYQRMINTLTGNFEQMIWMESNLFYFIIPCWMATASEESDGHKGWDAPEFIWESIVMKWEDREDDDGENYEIDLKNPEESDYFDLLQKNNEFRMDVAAAVACCYMWGHFTQVQNHFEISHEEYVEDDEETCTWVEWMNEYGIGVNIEAMAGDPQQLMKLWRPKDLSIAAHAINMTADKIFEENEVDWHEDLDEAVVKTTIDMEHVASFGADPWKEMKKFISQEEDLAEDHDLGINQKKPLSRILRQYHLMKPGVESQQGTRHGPMSRGDKLLYEWIYKLVEKGFARNPEEAAAIMYEQAEEKAETTYMARIMMNLIELGVTPEELDPSAVDPTKEEYGDEKEALIARFFGMDKPSYDQEWAKIEEHAFDPLDGLLEADQFDYTWSSSAALENDNRPQEWMQEEYK